MKVKFEVMESDAISGVLGEDGKSARMLSGNFKDSTVRTVVDVDFRFDLFPMFRCTIVRSFQRANNSKCSKKLFMWFQ